TAIGVMLGRAEKRGVPPGSAELREVREVAQEALEKMRSLSQGLHPSILDDGGLEKAIDWYIPVFEKQTGIAVQYEKESASPAIPERVGVNVYRVLQESLNNVARHSRTNRAWVRVRLLADSVSLDVEDHGVGIPERGADAGRGGLGTVAMRERADLLQGTIEFLRPAEGGTLVRLRVPLNNVEADGN
ncbi:MAG: ATP-binding protein, partial [Bryobacteraceae bacterium]